MYGPGGHCLIGKVINLCCDDLTNMERQREIIETWQTSWNLLKILSCIQMEVLLEVVGELDSAQS